MWSGNSSAKAAIGDLVRYDSGPSALMRVTDIIGGRYYGRAFHSTGTCTSRAEVFEPSEEDRDAWRLCHDANDIWIRGAWNAASAIEARRAATVEQGAVHESAVAKPDAQPTPVSDPISNKGER